MRIWERLQPDGPSHLADHVVDECEAMAKYAFGSGKRVPKRLAGSLEGFLAERHARLETGADDAVSVPTGRLKELAGLHEQLARIVAPAVPRSILYLERERHRQGHWRFLGAVPLVRGLMLAALSFLLGLIVISTFQHVNGHVNWQQEHGWQLLSEELYLLTAAGVGATFAALFRVNRFVVEGTYDPKFTATYWTRIVLGVIAGMILATLIPIEPSDRLPELTKPTFAMLGGFSVGVVYSILNRLVETLESLVAGDLRGEASAREKALRADLLKESARDRAKVTARLMALQRHLANGSDVAQASRRIDGLLEEIDPDLATRDEGDPSAT